MKIHHDISLNIAVGGGNFDHKQDNCIRSRIDRIMDAAVGQIGNFNSSEFGFSGADAKIRLFSSLSLAGDFWTGYAENRKIPVHLIVPGNPADDRDLRLLGKASSVTNINAGRESFAGCGSVMPDWIADQVDLALFLWDGSEDCNDREIWTVIQACRRSNIPSIWIDIHSPGNVYWSMDSYYDPFEEGKLYQYITSLFSRGSGAFDPPGKSRILLWKLWNHQYNRFMKKYKARVQPVPFIMDKVMDKENEQDAGERGQIPNLRKIVDRFYYYDDNAISYSQKYRTSIYMRSIIPFVAAISIAFGSFAETVLGFLFRLPDFGFNSWAVLASVGFLINGLTFFYVYRLSENTDLTGWHHRFIDNRFVAETLRLTAHFVPFGIPANYASSLNRFGSRISKNTHVTNEIRRIIRDMDTISVSFDRKMSGKLLNNLADLVNDQILYHKNLTARYTAIIKGLKRYTAILFAIGLAIVIGRGCLQFVLFYFDISKYSSNAQLETFVKSLINMFALIIPAWASYFSLKLSLSNFEGLRNSSAEMRNCMMVMKNLLSDERGRNDASFERIYLFSKELTKLMLGEVADWYSQIYTQKFTKL